MMSTEARYSPQGSYAGYVYGYLTSLLGFILTVIGEHFVYVKAIFKSTYFSSLLCPHRARGEAGHWLVPE